MTGNKPLNLYARLDQVLEEIMARWGIPGLGVGLVEGGEVVYARGFGVQSLDSGAPFTPDSIICTASITKCFVATAVMQWVERGRLSLDAPLVTYLPDFRLDDDRYRSITLRQVLSHTSGMPDMDEAEYDELVANPETDDRAAERYVHALAGRRLIAAPGERFAYSNIAYNVLGVLLARLSGQSFEASMQANILRPAGMHDSTLYFPDVPPDRLAPPHLRTPAMVVNPVYPYHRADAPASFLHSTVLDMCRWASACLEGHAQAGQGLLSPASYELMWTPAAEWGYPPLYEHIGLGWTLGHFDGVRTVSHGGMGFGWSSFLTLLPEVHSAAVILCNEESSARSRTIRAALHVLLGKEPIVNSVSWMVPISQALQAGGVRAAAARYAEIKDDPDYFFDPDELLNLAYQVMCIKNTALASEILDLNLSVFPDHIDSLVFLARLCLRSQEKVRAEAALRQALALDPECAAAAEMLAGTGSA